MTAPTDNDLVTKFLSMTTDFKDKSAGLMNEITGSFTNNMGNAVKNYNDLQNTYLNGYTGIATQADKANAQLLESMDKNYDELKKQVNAMYADMQKKANDAVDNSSKEFKTQCEDVTKKFPNLPDKAYKDVLAAIGDSKGKVNKELEKNFKELLDKMEKNYQLTKKELKITGIKIPKLTPLEATSAVSGKAMEALNVAMTSLQPAIKNLADQLPGSSKKK
ncbi:Serine--tRNA ligase [Orchesella cincta]|uniref:Serine--tRNA ligase n=1 Tax=Orchesella cincta TaxID=48709 RepID=A0A1D2ME01_ORCCI|nr:Serine--tRNA ligase [Orchesella cincta]